MGKLSRNKGAAFERKVARWMQSQFPSMKWMRNLDETQQGNVGDVRNKGWGLDLVIQCKHMKRPSPLRALDEAREAAITFSNYPDFGVAAVQEHRGTAAVLITPKMFAGLMAIADWYSDYLGIPVEDLILEGLDDSNGW